jgi:hypothetical protein
MKVGKKNINSLKKNMKVGVRNIESRRTRI